MKSISIAALLLAALFLLPATAKEAAEPAVNASTKDAFETVSGWVRGQMQSGGRYAEVTDNERQRVNARLDEMSRLFGQYGSVDQMPEPDKLKMFNGQEEVNALLAKRDGERLVCRNVKPIGSNIPVKQCQTAAEMEARRRGDTEFLRKRALNSPQYRSGN